MTALEHRKALVLNRDWTPISVDEICALSWQDAIVGALQGKHDVIKTYPNIVARSARSSIEIPAVVVLKTYHRPIDLPAPFTRRNVWLRDRRIGCAYCREKLTEATMTFDHIIPRSRGGPSTFLNICSCCSPCNKKKKNRTPKEAGMKLTREPYVPTLRQINQLAMPRDLSHLPTEWLPYLENLATNTKGNKWDHYWDVELEP